MVDIKQVLAGLPQTKRIYLMDSYLKKHKSQVTNVFVDHGQKAYIVLRESLFHPQGGGQPSDIGFLKSISSVFEVRKVLDINGVFAHNGRFVSGSFKENDEIECEIDWELRYKIMKLHTTGHILDYALRKVYGKEVGTLGALHGPPKAYTIYTAEPPDQVMLNSIEKIANEIVREDKNVSIVYVDAAKLPEVAVNAPNLDRLPASDRYRIVIIDGVNGIPCAGTHVKKTGEVEHIKVLGAEVEQEGFKLYYDVEP